MRRGSQPAHAGDAPIDSADRALYEAKRRGRNEVVFCPPGGSLEQTATAPRSG